MKKNNSSPYRTTGLKKVEAPNPPQKNEPKSKVSKGGCDYRVGGSK